MGTFLQAIGRAKPANAIRSALRDRSNEMRENYRLGLDKMRTDSYIQSQKNNAEIQAQHLESLTRKNQEEAKRIAEGDKNIPVELLTDSLMYDELRGMVKKYGIQEGILSEDGKTFKKRDEAKFINSMTKGTFAESMMKTRIDIARNQYQQNQSMIDEAMKKGDVQKAAKLKENSEALKRNLSVAQAKSDIYQKQQEMEIKQREIAVKERNARTAEANTSGSGGGYEKDKAKLVDDTRAFYSSQAKLLLDPESGLIRQGPKGNPNKYIKEYAALQKQQKADMRKISKGELPSWFGEDEKKSDDDIAEILRANGKRVTPETIQKFRELNGL